MTKSNKTVTNSFLPVNAPRTNAFCPKGAVCHVAHTFAAQFMVRFQATKQQRPYELSLRRGRTGQSLVRPPRKGPPINPSTGEIMKMNHMQSNSKPTATASMFRRALKRFAYVCAAGTLLLTATSSWAAGATNAYHWTNLVSNIASLVGTVNVANPEPTPPVPLIHQGSIQV